MKPTWIIHNVFDEEKVTFHTHGLNEYGSLELELNLPLAPEQGMLFVNLVADTIAKGTKYRSGQFVEGIFTTGLYLFETEAIHDSDDSTRVLRIIFPDPAFLFPWDNGCSMSYKAQLKAEEIEEMKVILEDNPKDEEYDESEMPFVQMEAKFKVKLTEGITEDILFDIGGFEFKFGDVEVPFDFEAASHKVTRLSAGEYEIIYTTGEGHFFNSYNLDDCHIQNWHEAGLAADEITAKYLSKATEITEFFVGPQDEDEYEIESIMLEYIRFYDKENMRFSVSEDVINDFNRKEDTHGK